MLKRLILAFGLYGLLTQGLIAQPNWQANAPVDKNVKVGKLENGLTYYIRKNTEPKQRAEFFIVQNVGAILEEDDQNGLAHFLEHMAFNGTKNFPGKLLLNYFESVGVKFGQNINAYTSLDETVYNLSDVPTTREGIVDSALLVLHDWSNFISLEDKEIDNERGVIREEWRTGRGPERRMNKELMPIMYKDSKYAKRDIIGDLEIINNFKYQTIKDYYHKWYRPDLQSIIVVGDVDVDKIEQKIRSLFADIPKRDNPTPRPFFEVPDNKEPLIGIATDPEARNTTIIVNFKRNTVANEAKNLGYLKNSIVEYLVSTMLIARYNELVQKPNPPFVYAYGYLGTFTRTKDAFTLYSIAKNDGIVNSLKSTIREAERVALFGFTATELDRAKADYLRMLENQLKEKDKEKNSTYVYAYQSHFLKGEPIPGIEFDYMFASGVLPTITINDINSFSKTIVTKDNMVIAIMGPKKDGIIMPTAEEVKKAIGEVKSEKLEAYVDKVSNKPLVEKVAKPGKISSSAEDKLFGTIEWTLSNGAKVVIKKTDFKEDQVILNAFSKGGTSLVDVKSLPSAATASQIVTNAGVGEFSSVDLEKMLAGKVVQVMPVIGETSEGFQGSSSPKDFETMLQLVYLYFTQPREDVESFNSFIERRKAMISNMSADPRVAFSDSVSILISNRSPRVMPMNLDYIGKIDFKQSMDFYKNRFADASDFVFVLVGNINPDEIKPLVEKYIGGLPSINRKEDPKDNNVRPPLGKVQNYFVKPLQTPKSSVYIAYTGKDEYNLENIVLFDYIKSILRTRYTEEIREKEGATYGVGVGGTVRYFPYESYITIMNFDTDPKLKDKMIGIIHNEINDMMTNGPTEENLIKAREFMLKQYDQNQRENSYWSSTIRSKYFDGIDVNTKYLEIVNSMTTAKIKEAAKKLFEQGNIVEVVMSPKE